MGGDERGHEMEGLPGNTGLGLRSGCRSGYRKGRASKEGEESRRVKRKRSVGEDRLA